MVFGPVVHQVSSVDALNTSVAALHDAFSEKGKKEGKEAGATYGNWVDVRDVAYIHVEALWNPKAGGQRYISSAGPFSWQSLYDALQSSTTARDLNKEGYPKGAPRSDKETKHNTHSRKKAEQELGVKFKMIEESVPDTLRALKARGF